MLTKEHAERIGNRWLDLWNNNTVDEYLTQYRNDIVLVSSVAFRLYPDSNGCISDKKILKEYWELVCIKTPQFKFVLEKLDFFENKILVFYTTQDLKTKAIAILTIDNNDKIYKCEVSYV